MSCIGSSALLTAAGKPALIALAESLPDGDSLCHGDFHPGNVLYAADGEARVIDWSAASRGDAAADVAHSFILMKVVPRLPGVGAATHLLQRYFGGMMAKVYLKAIPGKADRLERLRPLGDRQSGGTNLLRSTFGEKPTGGFRKKDPGGA